MDEQAEYDLHHAKVYTGFKRTEKDIIPRNSIYKCGGNSKRMKNIILFQVAYKAKAPSQKLRDYFKSKDPSTWH